MAGEPSRVNGRLGGRPRGALPRDVYEARKKARKSLQELCQRNEEKYVAELERIALSGFSEAARISAIGMLLDRGRGKASQQHDHEHGGTVVMVHTGVPESDGPKWNEPGYISHKECGEKMLGVEADTALRKNTTQGCIDDSPIVTRHTPDPWKHG